MGFQGLPRNRNDRSSIGKTLAAVHSSWVSTSAPATAGGPRPLRYRYYQPVGLSPMEGWPPVAFAARPRLLNQAQAPPTMAIARPQK
jgi:hypothetical protein